MNLMIKTRMIMVYFHGLFCSLWNCDMINENRQIFLMRMKELFLLCVCYSEFKTNENDVNNLRIISSVEEKDLVH